MLFTHNDILIDFSTKGEDIIALSAIPITIERQGCLRGAEVEAGTIGRVADGRHLGTCCLFGKEVSLLSFLSSVHHGTYLISTRCCRPNVRIVLSRSTVFRDDGYQTSCYIFASSL